MHWKDSSVLRRKTNFFNIQRMKALSSRLQFHLVFHFTHANKCRVRSVRCCFVLHRANSSAIQHIARFQKLMAALALAGDLCLSRAAADGNYGTHLRNGECFQYTSAAEYFLYCCCYEHANLCDYSEKTSRRILEARREFWLRNPQIREFRGIVTDDNRAVSARVWNYRDFVHSRLGNRLLIGGYWSAPIYQCSFHSAIVHMRVSCLARNILRGLRLLANASPISDAPSGTKSAHGEFAGSVRNNASKH